jgi:hypothetical protein
MTTAGHAGRRAAGRGGLILNVDLMYGQLSRARRVSAGSRDARESGAHSVTLYDLRVTTDAARRSLREEERSTCLLAGGRSWPA